jgi:hypothetical protein
MSDTIDAMKKVFEGPAAPEDPAALVERMIAEHQAQEEEEAREEINPFDLINKGVVKINTDEELDAIGKLLLDADRRVAEVETIEAKRVAREQSRATRLHAIFDTAAAMYVRRKLEGKKRRSWLGRFAEFCLRKKPAHNETTGDADLLAFVERDLPDAITYTPRVSLEVVKTWEAQNGKPAPGRIHVEESESFAIKMPKQEEKE